MPPLPGGWAAAGPNPVAGGVTWPKSAPRPPGGLSAPSATAIVDGMDSPAACDCPADRDGRLGPSGCCWLGRWPDAGGSPAEKAPRRGTRSCGSGPENSPRLLGGLDPGGGAAGADAGVSAPRRAPGCTRPPPRAAPAVCDTTLLARYIGEAEAGGEEASSKPPLARGTGAVRLSAGC
jgi:hypothetical protein